MVTKIEQTRHFKMNVEHMTHIGNEYKHMSNREEVVNNLLTKMIHAYGKEYARKAGAAANRKLHYKCYIIE